MRVAGRILFFTALLVFVAGFGILAFFEAWRSERMEELAAGSRVVETNLGPVEVAEAGDPAGMPILVLHGAGGGYDQGLAFGDFLAKKNYRVISISRPGYLRTPLSSGVLVEEQGALAIAVLDALRVGSAAIVAVAEGTPAAVHAATTNPRRVTHLVLMAPAVLRAPPPPMDEVRLPAEAVLEYFSGDVSAWWITTSARWSPLKPLTRTLEISTALIPFECFKLAEKILADAEKREWFPRFFQTLAPVSPRESGTRNDLMQMRTLPALNFSKLTVPALVLAGRLDKLVPAANSAALLKDAPGAVAVPLRDSGFFTTGMGPQAAEAENAVDRFLRGLSPLPDKEKETKPSEPSP